jgi:LPXTG-site transpeptidase (sortase) family protein
MKKLLTWFFILQGFSLFTVGLYQIFLREYPQHLAFDNYQVKQSVVAAKEQQPIKVTIKDLGISLPIIPSKVVSNQWEVTPNGASYLVTSPIPGTTGNSIIYAHNWTSLFGNLVAAKIGQTVEVEYADHTKKTFVISYTSLVDPNESTILAPSTDKRITLYTCTGFLDSKRFVAVATLKDN